MNLQHFELQPLELEVKEVKEVVRCLLHTILFNRALGSLKPKEADCDVFDPSITYARADDAQILKTVDERVDAFDAALSKALGGPHGSHHTLGANGGSSTGSSGSTVPTGSSGGGGSSGGAANAAPIAQTCILSFYEEVSKQSWGGLRNAKEKVYWEQWNIPIVLANTGPPGSSALTIGGASASSASSGAASATSGSSSSSSASEKKADAKSKSGAANRERRAAQRASTVRDRLLYIADRVNAKMDHIPAFKKGSAVCYPFDIGFVSGLDGTGAHTAGDATGDSWAVSMFKRVVQAGPPLLIKQNN